MVLWRISPFHDLNGEGGRLFSARWHIAGLPVVYLAESPAGALLEICAHTSIEDVPPIFTLLKVVGQDVAVEDVAPAHLPEDWIQNFEATQRKGMEWLQGVRSTVLRVPSVLAPETWNCLLNPLHPDASQFQIERVYEYPFDLRPKS